MSLLLLYLPKLNNGLYTPKSDNTVFSGVIDNAKSEVDVFAGLLFSYLAETFFKN